MEMLSNTPYQPVIINLDENSRIENELNQPKRMYLDDVPKVKAFFRENNLPYVDGNSRDKNILDNINLLPTNPDCIYVFENISFLLSDGVKHQFPGNYRFKNCEVVGHGELEFNCDKFEPEESIVLNTIDCLRKEFGLYYPEKSIVWNIKQAENVGNWPDTGDVSLVEMLLDVDKGMKETLPKNACLIKCEIAEGDLAFTSGSLRVVGENAIGRADGPYAKALATEGKAYALNGGSADASLNGKSFALHDGTCASAEGPNATATGMANGSTINVIKGATGYKHVKTVIAKKDDHPDSKILMSAVHREPPPEYHGSTIYVLTERAVNYKNYVLELKDLFDLGEGEAARKLNLISDAKFNALIPTGQSKILCLEILGNSATGEEAKQLCEEYMNRYSLELLSTDYWNGDEEGRNKDYTRENITIHTWTDLRRGAYCYLKNTVEFSGDQEDRVNAKKYFNMAKEKGAIKRDTLFGWYEKEYKKHYIKPEIKHDDCIIC